MLLWLHLLYCDPGGRIWEDDVITPPTVDERMGAEDRPTFVVA